MEKETEVADVLLYPPLESSVLCEERMSQRFGCRDANVGTEGQTLLQEERGQRKMYICSNGCCDMIKLRLSDTDQLTHSRSFSSGPWLCSSLVQEPFGPQLMEYEIRLSLGQSSSRGKPITLTNTAVEKQAAFFVLNKSKCLNQALLVVVFYTVGLLL